MLCFYCQPTQGCPWSCKVLWHRLAFLGTLPPGWGRVGKRSGQRKRRRQRSKSLCEAQGSSCCPPHLFLFEQSLYVSMSLSKAQENTTNYPKRRQRMLLPSFSQVCWQGHSQVVLGLWVSIRLLSPSPEAAECWEWFRINVIFTEHKGCSKSNYDSDVSYWPAPKIHSWDRNKLIL